MTPDLRRRRAHLEDWLRRAAFPLWWETGGDRRGGGFHEAIEHQGSARPAPRRARVQARQIYCYAKAGGFGWTGPWREAVDHGLGFLMSRYRRSDGLYRTLLTPEGEIKDETAWLYDQAFTLFAFAEARACAAEGGELTFAARELRARLEALRHAPGGFREASEDRPFQSNPHMHLFEAALAWAPQDPNGGWDALADEIAELALTRFIDAQGAVHEFFAADWGPAPGVAGRIVEPGHQFEWAWLLERWSRLRDRPDAHTAALRLYEIGDGYGVDRRRGVAFDQLLDDFTPHQTQARLWPQTERLKAALILAEGARDRQRTRYLDDAALAADGLLKYLECDLVGLWRDKMGPDGAFVEEPAPASSFYHIVCAVQELSRLAPEAEPTSPSEGEGDPERLRPASPVSR